LEPALQQNSFEHGMHVPLLNERSNNTRCWYHHC